MSTILFAGDSYAVADPEHKHHGDEDVKPVVKCLQAVASFLRTCE